jgi:hypothetical protein
MPYATLEELTHAIDELSLMELRNLAAELICEMYSVDDEVLDPDAEMNSDTCARLVSVLLRHNLAMI